MKYPAPWVDEGLTASRAVSQLRNGNPSGELDKRLLALTNTVAGQSAIPVWPSELFAVFMPSVGDISLIQIRAVSLIFGSILILSCFFIGTAFSGIPLGILFALTLGTSIPFAFASHVGRADIMGIAGGCAACAVFLHLGHRHWLFSLFAGFIVGSSFELHARASIYGITIASLYWAKFGTSFIRHKNFWFYVLGGTLGLGIYAAIHILPDLNAFVETQAVVNSGRTPPGGRLGFEQLSKIISSAKEIALTILMYQSWVVIIFALFPFVAFTCWKKNGKSVLAFIGATLAGAVLLMDAKGLYNAIAYAPAFSLGVAYVVYVACCTEAIPAKLRLAAASLVGSIFVLSSGMTAFAFSIGERHCSKDFENTLNVIRSSITPEDFVMSDETYWLGLQNQNYMPWKTLKSYQRARPGASLADAFQHFKPDIFVIDGFVGSFFGDEKSEKTFQEELRLPTTELSNILLANGKLVNRFDSTCYGRVDIFRFQWK